MVLTCATVTFGDIPRPVRILYLGLPLGALHLLGNRVPLAGVLLGHADAPGARRLRRRLPPGTLLLARPDLDDPVVLSTLASLKPDAILSFFWPRRIPESVLALAPRGAFGTHPSLLPRWRGPDPYFWAIREGDTETGVTLHRLARDYDTGAILEKRTIPLLERYDAWTLARALDRPALALLLDCARRLEQGELLEGVAQDDSLAAHAPEPDEEDLSIDWHEDAESIVRHVRAAAPTPAVVADIEGEVVEVVRARVYEREPPRSLEPAEAFIDSGTVVVRAGRGAVRILEARDERGDAVDLVERVEAAQQQRNQAS